MADTHELAERLTALGYANLFLIMDNTALEAIWAEPDSRARLEALAYDQEQPFMPRFLAAEILFAKAEGYPPADARTRLAHVYAAALAHEGVVNANIWAMPDSVDGATGLHVLALGAAVPVAFAPLLDDQTPLFYEGSEEATVGNAYNYRVKDLAALFISSTARLPYTVHPQPQERDAEIERLRKAFAAG
jgi:hypothetical protein